MNFGVLLAGIALCLAQVSAPSWKSFTPVLWGPVVGSFAVWAIHRYPLHRRIKPFGMAYKRHTLEHHKFFSHRITTWESSDDWFLVFFPFFTIPLYWLAGAPVMFALGWLTAGLNAGWVAAAMGAVWFVAYEVVHFCSHLPADHAVHRIGFMAALREHHRLHHDPKLMKDHNFNVVWPLADRVMGTRVQKRP